MRFGRQKLNLNQSQVCFGPFEALILLIHDDLYFFGSKLLKYVMLWTKSSGQLLNLCLEN